MQVLIVMVALLLLHRWKVDRLLRDTRHLARFILALVIATSIAVPIYGLRMWLVFDYPPERAIAFGFDYFLSALFSFLIFTPLVAGTIVLRNHLRARKRYEKQLRWNSLASRLRLFGRTGAKK